MKGVLVDRTTRKSVENSYTTLALRNALKAEEGRTRLQLVS